MWGLFDQNLSMTDDEWVLRQREQAAGFDAIGARYDEVFPHKDGQVRTTELLLERLAPAARVLDLGCGTGLPTAQQLASAGCAVTGIDISPVMLDLARKNVPAATFVQCDAVDLDASLGRFDAVVAYFSLLMLPRAQIASTLTALHDILVAGGWLAVGMVEADIDDVPLSFLGTPLRVTGWPFDQLRQIVAGAGFTVEIKKVYSYSPPTPEVPPESQLFVLAHR
jgi:ubiquinone/menaquinone biosynthesis C-methylase UbiE